MRSKAKNPTSARAVRMPVDTAVQVAEPSTEDQIRDTRDENKVLTIEDVAGILRCSKTHVSNALNGKINGTPRLTHFSIGRRKLVRREWLDEWMEVNKSA